MGNLIDINDRLEAKRLERARAMRSLPEIDAELAEIAEDLFSEDDLIADLGFVRDNNLCQTCSHRVAVADVYRSDATASGLGGRLFCRNCLVEELRHNRIAPRSGKIEWLVAEVLEGIENGDPVRVEISWDPLKERAVRFDGTLLP